MDNLALKIIDEMQDGTSFVIDSDSKAEWAIKKLQEETAETQRMINVCDTFISEYQFKKQKELEHLETRTFFLKQQLREYFERVPHKVTKTQETYTLPSGKLKLKIKEPEFIRDEKVLGKWLETNNYLNYYEIVIKPKWAELKKCVEISGDKVVDAESGLLIEGVIVKQRENEFEIEF
jgi:hypothetical protein